MTVAVIPVGINECRTCPYSMFHSTNGILGWYCIKMKGKTFKDPFIVQEWCPYARTNEDETDY